MADMVELSLLLGAVYDAALDTGLWPAALEKTCGYLNGMSGALGSYDILQKNHSLQASWGYDPEFLKTFAYYSSINPLLRPSFRLKVGEVGSVVDAMPLEEYWQHRVHREWSGPQRIIDIAQTNLERTPLAMAVLGITRHEKQGPVDQTMRDRMALIAPHFRRSLLIGKVIDLAKLEAAAFSDTIDGLAAAVFLVDAEGELLHANTHAEAMLAKGDPFHSVNGALTAIDAKVHRNLTASFAASAAGDIAVEARGIAVPVVTREGERFAAHVLPMTSGRRRESGAPHAAVAALFVREVQMEFPAVIKTMAENYRLTTSEVRVLHVLLEVGGIAHTALMLRLTDNTVKTHLRHIFQKTGARNQVDLVKLVAGLSSPLGHPGG